MSNPIDQHIIPKCHLKNFVDHNLPKNKGKRVWVFDKKDKIGRDQHIRSTLTSEHFYTVGDDDFSVETSLQQIEDKYSKVFYSKIKHKLPLSTEEHLYFCAFLASMLQRTVSQKENVEHMFDQILERLDEFEGETGKVSKAKREWLEKKKDAHSFSIIEMVPEMTKILMEMNIAFMCSQSKTCFITSDTPAFLFNSRLQFSPMHSPGLGQKHVELRMPLSTEISVCFSWINNVRGYLGFSKNEVDDWNRMTYGHSHKYFIVNSRNTKKVWFNRMPTDPLFIGRVLKHKVLSWYRRRKYVSRNR